MWRYEVQPLPPIETTMKANPASVFPVISAKVLMWPHHHSAPPLFCPVLPPQLLHRCWTWEQCPINLLHKVSNSEFVFQGTHPHNDIFVFISWRVPYPMSLPACLCNCSLSLWNNQPFSELRRITLSIEPGCLSWLCHILYLTSLSQFPTYILINEHWGSCSSQNF